MFLLLGISLFFPPSEVQFHGDFKGTVLHVVPDVMTNKTTNLVWTGDAWSRAMPPGARCHIQDRRSFLTLKALFESDGSAGEHT